MLCTSRLTPLLKKDGAIRPIACGELFYGLATKVLLRKAFRSDYLEPFQLGVGSKGGVEPVVWTVELALAGQLDQDYTHLVSLDAINAFNAMARGCVAQGTSQFAPMLYRVAKWAYNSTTDLVVGDYIIQSSQGQTGRSPWSTTLLPRCQINPKRPPATPWPGKTSYSPHGRSLHPLHQ